MTVKIIYELQNDAQYLVMWSEAFDKSRYFIAGPDGVVVPRGQLPPTEVKHSITTVMLQELLDELIGYGLRPSTNAWSAGHISDLKKHIDFAERVSFKLLEKGNG